MDLMEYKARELFEQNGLPVKSGIVAQSTNELAKLAKNATYPLVVKAQVMIGGRGKAGGIRFANNEAELIKCANEIIGMNIKGHIVKRVMAVEKALVKKEMYLSIMLDCEIKCPVIIFCPIGGMDIEETAKTSPKLISKVPINPLIGLNDYAIRYLVQKGDICEELYDEFKEIVIGLYKTFMDSDCTLCEVNPLAITNDNHINVLDAKVSVDDSAVARHTYLQECAQLLILNPLVAEAKKFKFLYIPCDDDGDIAVMSNGSGMLMSCIDLVTKKGMKVRAAVDMGGGATAERIKEVIRIIMSDEKTDVLMINIFGGITRCDEVAEGIRLAYKEYEIKKDIIVRFEGTNKQLGLEILKGTEKVTYVDGLYEGVDALENRRDVI